MKAVYVCTRCRRESTDRAPCGSDPLCGFAAGNWTAYNVSNEEHRIRTYRSAAIKTLWGLLFAAGAIVSIWFS